MGVSLYVHDIYFEIRREYFKHVLDALDRCEKLNNWWRPPIRREEDQVKEWFRRMGFEAVFEPDQYGDLITIWWDGEKSLTEQKHFFQTIAKYVTKGCYINCEVEVGDHFQWYFNGDCMIVKDGKVVYE